MKCILVSSMSMLYFTNRNTVKLYTIIDHQIYVKIPFMILIANYITIEAYQITDPAHKVCV